MENTQVARILYDIARLLEIQEENIFKIRAYENAARALEGLSEDVQQLVEQKRLQEVPGIGKAISEKIEELVKTGRMEYFEKLTKAYPSTLFELLRVPNLGPKKIRRLYDELKIKSLTELEDACKQDRLVTLKGFGKKTQEKIIEGIRVASATEGQHLLGRTLPIARELLEYLRRSPAIDRVEIAGSVRRWKEIINDIDFVVSTTRPAEIQTHFLKMPFVSTVIAKGDTKVSVKLDTIGIQVDLRIVKPPEFATALHHFTGSKEHNVVLRTRAKSLGYKINEYGIFKEGKTKPVRIDSEEEFYHFFDMDYVPPEMRENLGEVEAALSHALPNIIGFDQLKGVFHVHSLWSDGRNTLEQMVREATNRGYNFVGVSEHSKSAGYAHGLDEQRLREQQAEVDRLQEKYSQIKILKGIEVDILQDGSLDFDDEILSRLDFVIASVHSGFRMEEKEMTTRICKAISNPHVDILGHLTGRLLLNRKGYAVNLDEVFKTAARHHTYIEINASPHRLDVDWTHLRRAKEMGARFAINPDAHSIKEFDYTEYGLGVARKGWVTPQDVLNAQRWEDISL